MPGTIGQTETQFFHHDGGGTPFVLSCGESLDGFTLAYESYGEMSPAKDNVILVFHALTASQHAAGHTPDVPGLSVEWDKECQLKNK